jgi:hypothetical protein
MGSGVPRRGPAMTYLNPLIAPVVTGPQAQKASADKERQIARTQVLAKDSAAGGDRFEHTVESADALSPVGDEPSRGGRQPNQQKSPSKPQDDAGGDNPGDAHIDVTG